MPQSTEVETASEDQEEDNELQNKSVIKGCAILEVRTPAKLEVIQKAISELKLTSETEAGEASHEQLGESLTLSTVNNNLYSEPQGNTALEAYLKDLIYTEEGATDFKDQIVLVLTEIFHSCFMSSAGVSGKRFSSECFRISKKS